MFSIRSELIILNIQDKKNTNKEKKQDLTWCCQTWSTSTGRDTFTGRASKEIYNKKHRTQESTHISNSFFPIQA